MSQHGIHSNVSVYIVVWKRLFSLLRGNVFSLLCGNVCFHCCVSEEMQQCRTVQLLRNRRPRLCYQGNLTCDNRIRVDLREIGLGGVDWIRLAQDRDRWWAVVSAVIYLRVLAPRS
jgi:hypothetical protein